MPRHQNTAAQCARQAQRDTGGKYTAELRKTTPAEGQPGPFTLGKLLTACGPSPDWTGQHPVVDPEQAPEMFDFTPLGEPVPYSTVMLLLGLLAPASRSTELELESRNGFHSLIVACCGRRFEMVLTQDDYATERCRVPGCDSGPVSAHSIPYCVHRHLAERPEDELVEMARAWGHSQREEFSAGDPAAVALGKEGDRLIAAAVAQGACFPVKTALIEAAYDEPEMVDVVYCGEQAVHVHYAMDTENFRLERVARAAHRRIQKLASGRCACGAALQIGTGPKVPPQFCSAACAAAGPQTRGGSAPVICGKARTVPTLVTRGGRGFGRARPAGRRPRRGRPGRSSTSAGA
ncbi:hypothetical protein ACFFSH_27290 [Streptomyces filamentosus]|uniref:Uncharacterized protein n=1 Tax=Streptomyces filamentosus TaxID=67294 RepID=A0A919ESR2_STRFL|nr:hypothetical protein [Streptomyces filamentosus]GHG30402.1 hypothetical protein GCM10017667_80410 [Streptomyces filamentosus]